MIKIIVIGVIGAIASYKIYRKINRNIVLRTDSYIPYYKEGRVPEIDCIYRKTGEEGLESKMFYKETRLLGKLKGKVLPVILGRDSKNEIQVIDLSKYPHMLVAGATNMGKSNFINSVLLGLFLHVPKEYIKIYVIDFKKTGFFEMRDLIDISTDMEKAKETLDELLKELERRNTILAEEKLKNWQRYIQHCIEVGKKIEPYIICIIDEYNSLKGEPQAPVERLVAQARAVGIYMILCTQYPKTRVMNSEVTSQCLTRCCFKMASDIQERVVLDKVEGVTQLKVGYFYYKGAEEPGIYYAVYVGDEVFKVVGENIGEYIKQSKIDRGINLGNKIMIDRKEVKNSKSILSRLI